MPTSKKPPVLRKKDASVTSLVEENVHIFFDCGISGNILAVDGLEFSRLKPPLPTGKIIKVSSESGAIVVEHIGADAKHTTLLGLDKTRKGPDELHIRVPIGVHFFQIDMPANAPAGYVQAFFFHTNRGYNIIPHYLPLTTPKIDDQQQVNELILITSPIPPRSGPIRAAYTDKVVPLNSSELAAVQKPDEPPA